MIFYKNFWHYISSVYLRRWGVGRREEKVARHLQVRWWWRGWGGWGWWWGWLHNDDQDCNNNDEDGADIDHNDKSSDGDLQNQNCHLLRNGGRSGIMVWQIQLATNSFWETQLNSTLQRQSLVQWVRLEPQDGLSLVCDLVRSCRWKFTTARPPPRLSNDTLARIIFGAYPSIVNQPNLVQFTTKSSTPLLCTLSFGKGSNTKTREVWWVLWWFRRHICLHISDSDDLEAQRWNLSLPSLPAAV